MTTATSPAIAKYRNGNCLVELHADGTKVRSWSGRPLPDFPESIDLKISNWCDAGCPWCHEKSTKHGKHAAISDIMSVVDGLPSGVELACGGGNPMSHPDISTILSDFRDRGLISNITVNAVHVERFADHIRRLRRQELLFGLGVSFRRGYEEVIGHVHDERTVVHLIAGVDSPMSARKVLGHGMTRLLVLGYKQFGFGVGYYSKKVETCLDAWRYWIGSIMRDKRGIISFDNLALEQLNVRALVAPRTWDERYMGDDGSFTMYIDAVNREFAPTSTSQRLSCNSMTVKEMFQAVRAMTVSI